VTRFVRFAWGVLVYNLGVIAWGAYVRATGSGAGCGNHWPLCNGEVIPRAESVQLLIEFSHRASSGLALASVVVLLVWAFRVGRPGDTVRTGAALSMAFMITEAILGALLVKFQLVANDASAARAVAVAAHLLNTFLLLASLTLTVYGGTSRRRPRLHGHTAEAFAAALGAVALLVVSCAGAITALGDTLFPSASVQAGLAADLSSTSHVLIRLRTIHPILAVMVAVYLTISVWPAATAGCDGRATARTLITLVVVQLAAGGLNVLLLAPVWLQLLHLLLADAVWIAYVFLAAERLAERPAAAMHQYARPA
jgi:heme A synthase